MKRVIACILMTVVILLSLLVPAGAGMLTTEPRKTVSLWNADENWGDRYTLDTQNQTEGEGCISINLNGVTGTHAPSKKLDPVDATGMHAFEFDMYISDLAILDHLQNISSGSIEICSGGKCDEGEKNISLADVAKQLKNSCPKVGWNRVIIFLNKMAETDGNYGPFDISHINYLRIFWTGMTDCGQDWILKFDNFVLTDRQAAPNPHTPSEWEYDENTHWRYCTECNKKIDENEHSPFYWTNSPHYSTSTNLCEKEFTCYDCKQECGPYEHEFTVKDTGNRMCYAESATCTRGALFYYSCARCREPGTETFESGKPREHTTEKNCVSYDAESHVYQCLRCNEQVGEAVSHDFSEWETVREATEAESGLKRRSCAGCTYVDEQEIAYVAPEIPNDPETPDEPNTPDEPEAPQTPEQPNEEREKGCSAVLASGAGLCLVALMLAAGYTVRKKK